MQDTNINKPEIIKILLPVVDKAAEEAGLINLETNFVKESGKWHLKIFLYNAERPITHEDCQAVTGQISGELDEIIPVPFYLEVSSPGADRKLKSEKEYEIFKGKKVKIKVKKTDRDQKVFLAIIKDYSEEKGLTVELIDEEGELTIEKNNISYVKLEPEYNF